MAALTFPLSLDDFVAGLRVTTLSFDLSENLQMSETGGGEIITADLGPRLWQGQIEVTAHYHAAQRQARALAQVLRQAGRSFFVGDMVGEYPIADPNGAILGSATPTIGALDTDSRRLTISGLPAGYVLTRGDYLSFTYGSSPTRHALHQIVQGATANDTGLTPLIEVAPFIRPGATVGAAVRLIRPYCKAVMVPGSFDAGSSRAVISEGFSFAFRQTLR